MFFARSLAKSKFSSIKPLKVSGIGHPNMTTSVTLSANDPFVIKNPSEVMFASMIACENIFIYNMAMKKGFKINEVRYENVNSSIDVVAQFQPNPPAVRFGPCSMDVIIDGNLSQEDIDKLKEDVHKACPVYTTIKTAGIEVISNWKKK